MNYNLGKTTSKSALLCITQVVCVLLLGVSLVGCQGTPPSEGTIHDQNRARIEQGRYEDAIQSLSIHIQKYPKDDEARLLLASAYAARSGIQLRDFSGFAQLVLKGIDESPRVNGVDNASAQAEWEIQFVFRLIESIPEPANGIHDIIQAVRALNVSTLLPNRYMYRAVLKLIIFKYNFGRKYHMKIYNTCQVKPHALRRWYIDIERDLQDIISDVLSSRRNADEIEKLRKFKETLAETAQGINAGLDDYMSQPFVKLPGVLKKAYPECK